MLQHTLLHRLLPLVCAGLMTACASLSEPDVQRADTGGPSLVNADRTIVSPDQAKVIIASIFRLHDIAYRLRVRGHKLCGTRITHDVGLSYARPALMEKIGLKDALPLTGEHDRLTISHVVPGSAAERAGVRSGDWIESISLQQGVTRDQAVESIEATLSRATEAGHPFTLILRRGTNQLHLLLEPEVACDFRFGISWSNEGSYIGFSWDRTFGGVKVSLDPGWSLDDNTLALYISHQAAHGLRRDYERLSDDLGSVTTAIVDTPFLILSIGLGITGFPKFILPMTFYKIDQMHEDSEPKVDMLSLYMLALSGYDPSVLVSRLRTVVASKKQGTDLFLHVDLDYWNTTSELTKKRLEIMEEETAELLRKQREGVPLLDDNNKLQAIIREISEFNLKKAAPH